MNKIHRAILFSFVSLLLVVSFINASTPQIKTYKTQKDFEKGKARGVSINSRGEIVLGPRIDGIYEADTPFLWAWTSDARGNSFVGGGNSGKVIKVDAQGHATVFFETPEPEIYALAVDRQNNLLVGTSPHGKIYKVPPDKQMTAEEALFFDPKELYIWSLLIDDDNNLYAGTGDQGKIYKITQNGKGGVFYECADQHIRRLTLDDKRHLVAGTSSKGQILRFDSAGNAFVLYDSPLAEITGLVADATGNIFAAASGVSRIAPLTAPPKAKTPTAKALDENKDDDEDVFVLPPQEITATGPARLLPQNSALYRIEANGAISDFWDLHDERIYSLNIDQRGHLIIGTGDHGRLYSMTADGDPTLLTELDEIQITAIGSNAKGRLFLCTSNPAKLYGLLPVFRDSGEYLSAVIDASVVAQWGSISWEAEMPKNSNLVFYTRSGNTEKPDKTWSAWSKAYSKGTTRPISSPAARFIQFKAELSTRDAKASPKIKEVSIAYLQKNMAPQIVDIVVHEPNQYFPESENHNSKNSHMDGNDNRKNNHVQNQYIGRNTFKKGYQSVSWQTKDVNQDFLSFDLYYRGSGETSWKKLTENYSGFVYSWDTELLPDGRYFIKIVAKDEKSNPPALALTTEKVSPPFIIDNQGPEVSNIVVKSEGKNILVSFRVKDALTIIKSVEVGLNANAWKLVYPVDGICDSKSEVFEAKMKAPTTQSNTIVIKATDYRENIGFGKRNF